MIYSPDGFETIPFIFEIIRHRLSNNGFEPDMVTISSRLTAALWHQPAIHSHSQSVGTWPIALEGN